MLGTESRLSGPGECWAVRGQGGPVPVPGGQGSGSGPQTRGLAGMTDPGERTGVSYLRHPELGGRHFLLELEWQ